MLFFRLIIKGVLSELRVEFDRLAKVVVRLHHSFEHVSETKNRLEIWFKVHPGIDKMLSVV